MAASNINICVLSGNLTRDPELKETGGGHAVCELRIANNSSFKDKDGNWQEKPHFFQINCWGGLAKTVETHLAKGSKILATCRAEFQSWEKDGKQNSRVVFVANQIEFVGDKKKKSEPAPDSGDSSDGDDIPF